jgi:hypothetical protein
MMGAADQGDVAMALRDEQFRFLKRAMSVVRHYCVPSTVGKAVVHQHDGQVHGIHDCLHHGLRDRADQDQPADALIAGQGGQRAEVPIDDVE